MSISVTNNIEGLTDGTGVTTGNSGGTSGTAFNVVSAGTGGTISASSTQAAHGNVSIRFSQGTAACTAQWNSTTFVTPPTTSYGRMYVFFTSAPASSAPFFKINDNASNQAFRLDILSTGHFRVRSTGSPGTQVGSDSANAIPMNTWVRFEWQVVSTGSGTGSITVNYYATKDSASITETITGTTNAGANTSLVFLGAPVASPAIPTFYVDDVVINDTGYPGPVVTAPTANAGTNQTVTSGQTGVQLDGTGSTGGVTYTWRQISGGSVTLSSTTASQPTFTAPLGPDTLVFGLIVHLGGADSSESTVTISVNAPATPTAGVPAPTASVQAGSGNFTLTGTKSAPSGQTISGVAWTQAGVAVTLANTTTDTVTVTPPTSTGQTTLRYTVTASGGGTAYAEEVITWTTPAGSLAMTVTTSTGYSVTGAADIATALTDSSDTSYASALTGTQLIFTLPPLVAPSGVALVVALRTSYLTGSSGSFSAVLKNGATTVSTVNVTGLTGSASYTPASFPWSDISGVSSATWNAGTMTVVITPTVS